MEELQATQEEIARKERSYIDRIQELEEQVSASILFRGKRCLESRLFARREREYRMKLKELEKQLAQMPEKGDDRAVAEELEKTLSIHLEALKITQEEELGRKAGVDNFSEAEARQYQVRINRFWILDFRYWMCVVSLITPISHRPLPPPKSYIQIQHPSGPRARGAFLRIRF